MRILEITFNAPGKRNGGELGIYQSIFSLAENGEVDYIGPNFNLDLFKKTNYNINVIKILDVKQTSLFKRLKYFIFSKASTSFYEDWLVIKKQIHWDEYDIVHIDSSRYLFAVKEAKKNLKKTIVRVHNIESDYQYNIFLLQKNIHNYLRYYSFVRNEKKVIKLADKVVYLTEKDLSRSKQLYGNTINAFLNPVCIESTDIENNINSNNGVYNILLTGSLNYGPNVDGIIWFLDNVWSVFKESYIGTIHLIIAGAHPNMQLKEKVWKNQEITIVDTPDSMKDFFLHADVYIASVFNGAGMKVKVAEALSYGVPVIGTSHAFIGYEQIKEGLYLADTSEAFINLLRVLAAKKTTKEVKLRIKNEFDRKLSMKSSSERYRLLLNSVIAEGKIK